MRIFVCSECGGNCKYIDHDIICEDCGENFTGAQKPVTVEEVLSDGTD